MIEVVINETGDRAEADTPDAALFAARTLGREVRFGDGSSLGSASTVSFFTDGTLVRTVRWAELRT